jgi:putative methionine-R-sulfoxide reductase with GAF domain
MSTNVPLSSSILSPQARPAFFASLIIAIAAAATGILYVALLTQFRSWQLVGLIIISISISAGAAASAVLSRAGRPAQGLTLLIVTLLVMLSAAVFLVNGIGAVISFAGILLILVLAAQGLSPINFRWAFFASLGAGLIAAIIDFSNPATQITVPLLPIVLPWVLISIMAAFMVLIAVQFRQYPLQIKVVISFVGLVIVSALVLNIFTEQVLRSALTNDAGGDLNALAEKQALSVGDLASQEIELLQSFALSQLIQDDAAAANAAYTGDSQSIETQLQAHDAQWQTAVAANNSDDPLVAKTLNNITATELRKFGDRFSENIEVIVTDKYGGLVGASNSTPDYYQADKDWWKAAYNNGSGAIFISQPELDESNQSSSFIVAIPIVADGNQVIGVLRSIINADIFRATLLGQTAESLVGTDLIFSNDQFFDGEGIFGEVESEALTEIRAAVSSASPRYLETEFEEEDSLISYATVRTTKPRYADTIRDLNWIVVSHEPRESALAPADASARATLLISIVALGVAGLLGLFISQILVRPILNLTSTAEKISQGDLTAQAVVETGDEIGTLANTFNATTHQLRNTIDTLEERVANRTRAVTLSADVSRRLSGILNQQQLISEIVEQIRNTFNYYHVHIYLYDPKQEYLIMSGGTGEAAHTMLARGHKIESGRGLVGRAASSHTPILVPDVAQDPGWLPNPLLPDTKAELAVPLAIGANVLGVLDVQHNIVNGLAQEDQQIVQSIANQVVIALQNTRAYEQAQQQAENETAINTISQRLQGAVTLEEVLTIAARELGQALGAQRVTAKIAASLLASDRVQ